MVREYGKLDLHGRLSFRHTVDPTSRSNVQRFTPVHDAGMLVVRLRDGNGDPVPCWSKDTLLGAVGAKLRRLLLVQGERQG